MEHGLVVIEAERDPGDVLREAGELAAGVGAELTLLYVTTEAEYERKRETLAEYADHEDTEYNLDNALDGAESFVRDLGRTVLSDLDLTFTMAVSFDDLSEEVLDYAPRHDVDHVFLTGRKRSPVGKAVFGDEAQDIILNFDGATTIMTQQG